jgi:hypothetical protein
LSIQESERAEGMDLFGAWLEAKYTFGSTWRQLIEGEYPSLVNMIKGNTYYLSYRKNKSPFSTSDGYNNLQAFLLGLDLEAYFTYSSDCIGSTVYFLDDTTYLSNNLSDSFGIYGPFINFTGMLAGNFSDSLVNCFQFSYSVLDTSYTGFTSFSGIGNYFLAFLFN